MSGPIVFISHQRVKPGRFQEFATFFSEGSEAIEADKPGTIVFLAFADADREETRIVHVFPDAEAMDQHLRGADERSAEAYQFLEPLEIAVAGCRRRDRGVGWPRRQRDADDRVHRGLRPPLILRGGDHAIAERRAATNSIGTMTRAAPMRPRMAYPAYARTNPEPRLATAAELQISVSVRPWTRVRSASVKPCVSSADPATYPRFQP